MRTEAVFDKELLAEITTQLLRDRARLNIGATAGRVTDNDFDRMIGILLRLCHCRGRTDSQTQKSK